MSAAALDSAAPEGSNRVGWSQDEMCSPAGEMCALWYSGQAPVQWASAAGYHVIASSKLATLFMPKQYDNLGITFQYPDNWELDEEQFDHETGFLSVSVFSPGGGFWSVIRHPITTEPTAAVQQAVDAIGEEYENIEIAPATETVEGVTLSGFDLGFIYLDLTNTCRVRGFRTSEATIVVFSQAEDREQVKNGVVFEAMTYSLVDSLY
jgi:hypothetical protein